MTDADRAPAFNAPIAARSDSLPATLDGVVDGLWSRIAAAIDGSWSPWTLPTLVTVAEDGAPRARVLALRAADRASRRFSFHTDARSDKVAEMLAEPRVSLLFWDAADAIEARFEGSATVHHSDPDAAAAWRSASELRRSACSVALRPGTVLDAPERFDGLPALAADDTPFRHFALVDVEVAAIDWLWLGPHDLRRARFAWTGAAWSGAWIVP